MHGALVCCKFSDRPYKQVNRYVLYPQIMQGLTPLPAGELKLWPTTAITLTISGLLPNLLNRPVIILNLHIEHVVLCKAETNYLFLQTVCHCSLAENVFINVYKIIIKYIFGPFQFIDQDKIYTGRGRWNYSLKRDRPGQNGTDSVKMGQTRSKWERPSENGTDPAKT